MFTITAQTRIVALDLETTGLFPQRDRIVELAAVSWQNGREAGHFQALVNPGRPMPPAVIRVHGITDAMVRDQPPLEAVLPAFLDFCSADIVVAHNARFDAGFINAACQRLQLPSFGRPVTDTCSLARRCLPGCPNYRLETLISLFQLGEPQLHRALEDARACLHLFFRCLEDATEPPPLHGTIPSRTLTGELSPLNEALRTGATLYIEYQDVRGRVTERAVRPIVVDEAPDGTVLQAHCLLRNNTRHFYLHRIKRMWLEGEGVLG